MSGEDEDSREVLPGMPPWLLGVLLLLAAALAIIFLVAAQVVQTP